MLLTCFQDLLVAMYVTGGDEITTPKQPQEREGLEPKEKRHKSAARYFAVPEELVRGKFSSSIFFFVHRCRRCAIIVARLGM